MDKPFLKGFFKTARLHKQSVDSVQELSTIARQPHVQEYVNTLQERKKTKERATGWGLPATAVGLGAAGMGMRHLGNMAISPDDRRAVEDLIALGSKTGKPPEMSTLDMIQNPGKAVFPAGVTPSPDYQGSSSLFWDYNDRASRASKVKVYNKPVVDLIHKAKGLLKIQDQVGPGANAYSVEAANHYPAFERGPMDAYVHQVAKSFTEPQAYEYPNQYFKYPSDTTQKALPLTPGDKGAIEGLLKNNLRNFESKGNPSAKFFQDWQSNLNDYLKQQGYRLGAGPTTQGFKVDPAIHSLNHGQQQDLARNFAGYLSGKNPELGKMHTALLNNLSNNQVDAANAYKGSASKALTLLQDTPRAIGTGLIAGGGALGLWYLINKWRHRKHQEQAPGEILREGLQ